MILTIFFFFTSCLKIGVLELHDIVHQHERINLHVTKINLIFFLIQSPPPKHDSATVFSYGLASMSLKLASDVQRRDPEWARTFTGCWTAARGTGTASAAFWRRP